MTKTLLFATRNPSKLALVQALLTPLNLTLSSLLDYPDIVAKEEKGHTLEEIARNKARAVYFSLGKACFAIDTGLHILGLAEEQQPGAYVRRLGKAGREVEDEEMLIHYQALLGRLGEDVEGRWTSAIAYIDKDGQAWSAAYSSPTLFRSRASSMQTAGDPLNALQFSKARGKYLSEMRLEERIDFMGKRTAGILAFLNKHLSLN